MKLTLKQQKFADEFIISGNATRAYKKAYKNVKKDETAAVNGCRLLNLPKVQNYITERMEEIHEETIADQKEVLKFLTSIMRGEVTEEVLRYIGDGVQKISNIEITAKDRIKAAELIGKRYGLWTDRIDIEGNIPVMIIDDLDEDDEEYIPDDE